MFLRLFRKRIALALSSGAARGLVHLGVIRRLLKEGIEIKAVAGSSIGALIGAYFALNYDVNRLVEIALETDWQRFLGYLDFNLITIAEGGIIRGRNIERLLKDLFGEKEFSDCKIPLTVVATDLTTGQPLPIRRGKLWKAVRASISIPGIFPPVKLEDKVLVDGGVSMPVPVKELREQGHRPIWAVNALSQPPRLHIKRDDVPNLIANLTQSLFIMESSIANAQSEEADKVIAPDTSQILFYDFPKSRELIRLGEVSLHQL